MASKPRRRARSAESTKARLTRSSPAASSAWGGASCGACGIAEGATGSQPPSLGGISWPPSQGLWLDALRPAWASWIASGMRLVARKASTTRFNAISLASFHKPQAARRNAALRLDAGGFDDQQAGTGQGQLAVMHQVPVLGTAVNGGVLAHRRDDNAIGQLDAADLERRKQVRHGQLRIRKGRRPGAAGAASMQ
jgi:hypothetical protein